VFHYTTIASELVTDAAHLTVGADQERALVGKIVYVNGHFIANTLCNRLDFRP
jgi:hypothetical protein